MKRFLWMGLAVLTLATGCATSASGNHPSEPYYPYITDVPPSFYDNDPALRHWFTYPYWNPNSHI